MLNVPTILEARESPWSRPALETAVDFLAVGLAYT